MAECRRVGDWWAIGVPEAPGVFTQARRLDQTEEMARSAIATMLNVPPPSFDVVVAWEVPGGLGDEVETARTLRDVAELAQRDAGVTARPRRVAPTRYDVRDWCRRTQPLPGVYSTGAHRRGSQTRARGR